MSHLPASLPHLIDNNSRPFLILSLPTVPQISLFFPPLLRHSPTSNSHFLLSFPSSVYQLYLLFSPKHFHLPPILLSVHVSILPLCLPSLPRHTLSSLSSFPPLSLLLASFPLPREQSLALTPYQGVFSSPSSGVT